MTEFNKENTDDKNFENRKNINKFHTKNYSDKINSKEN